jgi:hypothetical protein
MLLAAGFTNVTDMRGGRRRTDHCGCLVAPGWPPAAAGNKDSSPTDHYSSLNPASGLTGPAPAIYILAPPTHHLSLKLFGGRGHLFFFYATSSLDHLQMVRLFRSQWLRKIEPFENERHPNAVMVQKLVPDAPWKTSLVTAAGKMANQSFANTYVICWLRRAAPTASESRRVRTQKDERTAGPNFVLWLEGFLCARTNQPVRPLFQVMLARNWSRQA